MRLRVYAALAAVTALSLLASYLLHSPQTPAIQTGFKYSDIVHGTFYARFAGDARLWFDVGKLEALRDGYRLCPVPYVDYRFEYPPVVGVLFTVSTCAGIWASFPSVYSSEEYAGLLERALLVHYNIHAIVLSASSLATVLLVARLLEARGAGVWRAFVIPLLPSTVMYTVYNWDALAAFLFVLGLYLYTRGRYTSAGFAVGLSVATKLLTVVAGLSLAVHLALRDREEFRRYTTAFLIAGVAPYVILYATSPAGFWDFVSHHAGWYCENCVYMLLVRDIWSPLHKILAALAIGFSVALVMVVYASGRRLYEPLFASTAAPIALNYVFTPQMMLMITPAAVLSLGGLHLLAYVVADAANSLIIVSFFWELGRGNPWTLEGFTQKIAAARNLVILALLTANLYETLRETLHANRAPGGPPAELK